MPASTGDARVVTNFPRPPGLNPCPPSPHMAGAATMSPAPPGMSRGTRSAAYDAMWPTTTGGDERDTLGPLPTGTTRTPVHDLRGGGSGSSAAVHAYSSAGPSVSAPTTPPGVVESGHYGASYSANAHSPASDRQRSGSASSGGGNPAAAKLAGSPSSTEWRRTSVSSTGRRSHRRKTGMFGRSASGNDADAATIALTAVRGRRASRDSRGTPMHGGAYHNDMQALLFDPARHPGSSTKMNHTRLSGADVRWHSSVFWSELVCQVLIPLAPLYLWWKRGRSSVFNHGFSPKTGWFFREMGMFTLLVLINWAVMFPEAAGIATHDDGPTMTASKWGPLAPFSSSQVMFANMLFLAHRVYIANKYAYMDLTTYEQWNARRFSSHLINAENLFGWAVPAFEDLHRELKRTHLRLGVCMTAVSFLVDSEAKPAMDDYLQQMCHSIIQLHLGRTGSQRRQDVRADGTMNDDSTVAVNMDAKASDTGGGGDHSSSAHLPAPPMPGAEPMVMPAGNGKYYVPAVMVLATLLGRASQVRFSATVGMPLAGALLIAGGPLVHPLVDPSTFVSTVSMWQSGNIYWACATALIVAWLSWMHLGMLGVAVVDYRRRHRTLRELGMLISPRPAGRFRPAAMTSDSDETLWLQTSSGATTVPSASGPAVVIGAVEASSGDVSDTGTTAVKEDDADGGSTAVVIAVTQDARTPLRKGPHAITAAGAAGAASASPSHGLAHHKARRPSGTATLARPGRTVSAIDAAAAWADENPVASPQSQTAGVVPRLVTSPVTAASAAADATRGSAVINVAASSQHVLARSHAHVLETRPASRTSATGAEHGSGGGAAASVTGADADADDGTTIAPTASVAPNGAAGDSLSQDGFDSEPDEWDDALDMVQMNEAYGPRDTEAPLISVDQGQNARAFLAVRRMLLNVGTRFVKRLQVITSLAALSEVATITYLVASFAAGSRITPLILQGLVGVAIVSIMLLKCVWNAAKANGQAAAHLQLLEGARTDAIDAYVAATAMGNTAGATEADLRQRVVGSVMCELEHDATLHGVRTFGVQASFTLGRSLFVAGLSLLSFVVRVVVI